MEDLDPLMNGQSHRARLTDTVKANYGGQSYADDDQKKNPGRGVPRGPRGGGRGGGVVGTRGRGSFQASSRYVSRLYNRASVCSLLRSVSKQEPEPRVSHHNPPPAETPRRRLDPALEPEPSSHGSRRSRRTRSHRGEKKNQNQNDKDKDNRPNKAPVTRRPIAPR
jgi:hypothetical protein